MQSQGMWSTLWRKYADYKYNKFERFAVWEMIEPYRRPKTFTALITIYVAAFYTGVIGAAVTEQLYKVSFVSAIDSTRVVIRSCGFLVICNSRVLNWDKVETFLW